MLLTGHLHLKLYQGPQLKYIKLVLRISPVPTTALPSVSLSPILLHPSKWHHYPLVTQADYLEIILDSPYAPHPLH